MNFFETILSGIINVNVLPGEEPGERVDFLIGILSNGLILMLTVIIIVAIVYAALAGLKYIRSQGEAEKVEEAQNSIKYVFIGILAVFLGIIVVVVITGVFSNPGSQEIRSALCLFLEPESPQEACIDGSRQDQQ